MAPKILFKARCINPWRNPDIYTEGKVYSFYEGQGLLNNVDTYMFKHVRNFDEFNRESSSTWQEVDIDHVEPASGNYVDMINSFVKKYQTPPPLKQGAQWIKTSEQYPTVEDTVEGVVITVEMSSDINGDRIVILSTDPLSYVDDNVHKIPYWLKLPPMPEDLLKED